MGKTGEKIKRSFQYALLAVTTGVLVGILDTIFGRGLLIISDIRNLHYLYLIPFLPVAGLAIAWLYQHFNKESLKGMTLVFETGQQKREEIPLALIPLVMVTTWITHLFGEVPAERAWRCRSGQLCPMHWGAGAISRKTAGSCL